MTWRTTSLAALGLVAVIYAAYANSLRVPFLLDDEVTILANPSLRRLSDLSAIVHPPPNVFSAGRPLLNFSFALNYAIGGTAVSGYHLVNLGLHVLASLVLFDVVRRTLALPRFRAERSSVPDLLALLAAGCWSLHPLQTAAVTYVSQRAESLMALCYLLTLDAFIRAAAESHSRRWTAVSIIACLGGALTKETIVTAPLVVLLFDRVFFVETFSSALRRRPALYAGYAATWAVLAWLMATQSVAARGIGFGQNVSAIDYGLTELRALVGYFTLSLWPHPLVFDYGVEFFNAPVAATVGAGLLVAVLLLAVVVAWKKSPPIGFAATAALLMLAPTTSVIPIALQPMAENRMYLPLAPLVILAVVGIQLIGGPLRAFMLATASAVALTALTVARNHDFRSGVSIWTDTVAKRPDSSRAKNNLGLALLDEPSRRAEARTQFEAALRLKPDYPEAHNNLGIALADTPQRRDEAIYHYEAALRLKPNFAQAHANLGNALLRTPGRETEALEHYRAALALQPTNSRLHANLAAVLASHSSRRAEAIAHFETALRLDAQNAPAHAGLARLLAQAPESRTAAMRHYEDALRLEPGDAETFYNFANLLAADAASLPRAIENYEAALRLNPDLAPAYNNLAIALYRADHLDEAIAQLEAAQQRGVADAAALKNLEQLRALRSR